MRKTKGAKSRLILDLLLYFIGAALYAVSICIFVKPNALVTGGFSGLALILNRLFNAPIGITVFVLNLPLFVAGYRKIGKGFVLRSILATALVSLLIDIGEKHLPLFHGDKILACTAGGILAGSGLALIFIRGGSTGGADIISKLVHLKYPHIALGRIIMACDFLVITLSAIIFRGLQNALYSALMIGISSAALDYFIYGSHSGKILLAVTKQGEKIGKAVNTAGNRGATIVPVIGAYTKHTISMLMIVVRSYEIGKIYHIIREYDPEAFITLLDAREITGRGFEKTHE